MTDSVSPDLSAACPFKRRILTPMAGRSGGEVSLAAARAAVGDDAFDAAMRDLSSTAAERMITIEDVVDALEAHSGGRLPGLRQVLGLRTDPH